MKSLHLTSKALLCALTLAPICAASSYTFEAFDVSGAAATFPAGINTAGEIVGCVTVALVQRGFKRLTNGTIEFIDYPGAPSTCAAGINDSGTIVGETLLPSTADYRGFVRTSGGTYSNFTISTGNSLAVPSINTSGVVAGAYAPSRTTFQDQVFTRQSNGDLNTLSISCGGGSVISAEANGINDSGQVSGNALCDGASTWQAFIRNNDGSTTLFVKTCTGTDKDGNIIQIPTATSVARLNNPGQVVGSFQALNVSIEVACGGIPGSGHGFVRNADGSFVQLDYPGANVRGTAPVAINDAGVIVGTVSYADGSQHGFIATPSE